MRRREFGHAPELPQVYGLGVLLAAPAFLLMFAAFAFTLLHKGLQQDFDIFLAICVAYPTIMIIPAGWLMFMADNPAYFFTRGWKKYFIRTFFLWIAFMLGGVYLLIDSWRFEFVWVIVTIFFLCFVCLAIINYYRNHYRKKKMLLTGRK